MAIQEFQFKQFTIRHDRSAMKVGTDGVLLGAWASPPTLNGQLSTINCLDIGTGTGLIALMLAQRFPDVQILGIDIDEASVREAKYNVEASPFKERITIRQQDFSHFGNFLNKYDLIVSNPPFYKEDTLSGNTARDIARHTTSLSFGTLVANTAKLLAEGGLFSVIIPTQSALEFISICIANRLYLTRRTNIRPREIKPFNRVLLEFSTTIRPTENSALTLYNADHKRTHEYVQLTKDFYLT